MSSDKSIISNTHKTKIKLAVIKSLICQIIGTALPLGSFVQPVPDLKTSHLFLYFLHFSLSRKNYQHEGIANVAQLDNGEAFGYVEIEFCIP